MNITFMIGNGFDLNLNLDTRYSDFYKYYIKKNPNDLISESIKEEKEEYQMWSDLELGLGNFLKNIDENQIDEFLDSKSTLERMLAEYLTLESERIKFKNEKNIADEFRKKILNYFTDFNAIEKDHYHQVVASTKEVIKYSFITFNYTNVLDKIITAVQKNCENFGYHRAGSTGYNDVIHLPHHLHGNLTEDLILGLDNTEQIMNEKLRTNPKLTNYIIKSVVNTSLGEKKIERAKSIIDQSKYICLFGLSIGETDTMWWNYIIEWLKKDKNNRLVLYINHDNNVQLSGQEKIRFRDLKREMMIERSHCEIPDLPTLVQDRIIVIYNSKIFNLENIILEDKPNE